MTPVFVEGVYAPWMAHPSLQGGIYGGGAEPGAPSRPPGINTGVILARLNLSTNL
jgi:hypothetical protein